MGVCGTLVLLVADGSEHASLQIRQLPPDVSERREGAKIVRGGVERRTKPVYSRDGTCKDMPSSRTKPQRREEEKTSTSTMSGTLPRGSLRWRLSGASLNSPVFISSRVNSQRYMGWGWEGVCYRIAAASPSGFHLPQCCQLKNARSKRERARVCVCVCVATLPWKSSMFLCSPYTSSSTIESRSICERMRVRGGGGGRGALVTPQVLALGTGINKGHGLRSQCCCCCGR